MARHRRPGGQASLKTLIFLLLIFALLHGLAKVVPLYIKSLYFRDTVKETARMAVGKDDHQILRMVLSGAEELGLPVKEENVTIERTGEKSLRLRVNYSVEVKFLGGFYRRFNFDCQAETPQG